MDNANTQQSQGAVGPAAPQPQVPGAPGGLPQNTPGNDDFAPQNQAPETFVIPPSGGGAGGGTIAQPPKGSYGGGPGSIIKKILLLLIGLLILGGIGYGGIFVYQQFGSGGPVTLTYWGLWENDALVRPVIADFEAANPDVTIEYVRQNHRQYRERLQAAIERGEGPDVFRFHNTWVAMLKNDLSPVPPDIMTPEVFQSTFYPVAARDLIAQTTIFGLPLTIDGLGLYYNEDLFAAAGVSPPTTYEDLLSITPKLTVIDDDEIVTSAIALGETSNVEHFSDIVATMMMQNGASLITPTSPEAEQTLIFYKKFSDPRDPVYTWDEKQDNSIVAFANGRVAMIMAPSWRAHEIQALNPNLQFRIVPIPQLPGNTVTWASYWVEGVSAKSKHQEAAWKFVSFLTSRESSVKLYTEASNARLFGEPYARVELGSSIEGDQFVGAYVTQAPDARSFPLTSRTFDNGINDRLIQYLQDAINSLDDGGSPAEALETAQQGFSQVLSSYGLSAGGGN